MSSNNGQHPSNQQPSNQQPSNQQPSNQQPSNQQRRPLVAQFQSVMKKTTHGRRTFDLLYAGTGRKFPTHFYLEDPDAKPHTLFRSGFEFRSVPGLRFFHRKYPGTFLVYTAGTCLDIGTENQRAGCGFVFGRTPHPDKTDSTYVQLSLENKGPTGEAHEQTSERAQLRAVIAASRFCDWRREGFDRMVIATDSDYVVEGITTHIRGWIQRGWRTETGASVVNRDLWECLLGEAEQWHDFGMSLEFWKITEKENALAALYAKAGANRPRLDIFHDMRP
ncbi:ribonuclease H-like domain-containing protein [Penicillium herquei]|nr:ribonuclease H-like domain-containing protein [Penicillium herquei]